MNYETKIYLDKLIEAVGELNTPDWWTIILTIINIVAFIFVAYTQIKLQEQQNMQQKYSLYNRLYKLIKTMDFLIAEHMSTSFYYYGLLRGTAPFLLQKRKVRCQNVLKNLIIIG